MWIPVQINENSAEPLYHQIETQLRSLIISGVITEGTLLPSIREFAGDLKCSVITVRRVYQDLENEGLLRTRQGTGTFVSHVGLALRWRNISGKRSAKHSRAQSTSANRYIAARKSLRRFFRKL